MEAAALLALLALLLGRKKTDQSSEKALTQLPAPGVIVFAKAWKDRCSELLKRGATGAKWVDQLLLAIGTDDTSAAVAASRWIGMESGGNPIAKSSLDERGLAQGMKASYPPADWTALQNPSKLTNAQHVEIAVRLMSRMLDGVKLVEFTAGNLGVSKLYHALPLLVKELHDQKILPPFKATVGEVLAHMLAEYKPSKRVAAFVAGKNAVTGDVRQDIALRFFAPAAVIAYGDASVGLLDQIATAAKA